MIKDYIKTLVIIEDYKRILKHVKVNTLKIPLIK
jgi:hypothetical protein